MLHAIAAVLCISIPLIFIYLTWFFTFWEKRGIRGPKPAILKGNFSKTLRGECNFVEELHEIYLTYKAKEQFVGVYVARSPRLFILDPRLAQQILTSNFSSFHDNESSQWSNPKVEQLRCSSPFVSVGDAWKERRNELGPALTISRLRSFYPSLQRAASKLTEFLETRPDDVDAKDFSGRFTTEVVADFIWGVNANAFDMDNSPVQEAASIMIQQALKCVGYFGRTAAWPWVRKLYPQRFFPKSTDEFFTLLTSTAKEHRLRDPRDRPDVLNHLLQLAERKRLSDVQMAGHSTTVLIDGLETAAIAICHCLLLLGRNRSAQEKLRQEILDNLEADDTLTFDRLNSLPFLDQCVQETLRIFPPLPTLFKLCSAATSLQNADGQKVYLRPGDGVYISSYSFHRDGDLFDRPEEFLPERFDPDALGSPLNRSVGGFLPFGDGPRMCLGMRLGLVETKVAVAEVVRKFDITPGSATRTDNRVAASSFLLSLEGGVHLNLKRLN